MREVSGEGKSAYEVQFLSEGKGERWKDYDLGLK